MAKTPTSILPKNIADTERKLRSLVLSPAVEFLIGDTNIAPTANQNNQNNTNIPNTQTPNAPQQATGTNYLNSVYGDEIEYYACALELVDSNGDTVEFFSFPVMPVSIQEQFQNIASIRKTLGGVVVNQINTFIPFNISVNGDFGRRFRNVYGGNKVNAVNGNNGLKKLPPIEKDALGNPVNSPGTITSSNNGTSINTYFDTENKTGYGCTKILENIFKKSLKADTKGKPYNLYFYNLAFNSKYNVEVTNFTFSQSREKNMIWTYSFALRALAPAVNTLGTKRLLTSIQNIRNLNAIQNEARQQSTSLNGIMIDPKNRLSKVEKILYSVSKTVNQSALKIANKNSDTLNAIREVVNLSKNQNRAFIGLVGLDVTNSIQRAVFLSRNIII